MFYLFSGKINKDKMRNNALSVCQGLVFAKIKNNECIKNPSLAIKGRPPYNSELGSISVDNVTYLSEGKCSCLLAEADKMSDANHSYTKSILMHDEEITILEWLCADENDCL